MKDNIIGVYFLYNINNEIVYVGKSKNIVSRLKTHNASDKAYSNCAVIPFKSEADAIVAEVYFICKLKPYYNKKDKVNCRLTVKIDIGEQSILHYSKSLKPVCSNLIIDSIIIGVQANIPNNIQVDKQVKSIKLQLKASENRRHQTPTQLACTAVLSWNTNKPKDTTQKEFIATYAVSIANFANAQWLYKNNRQVFEALRNGKKVTIDSDNKYKTSDSLTAVVRFYKNLEVSVDTKDIDATVRDNISISVENIVNPLLDAMVISLNALAIPEKRLKDVKEEIAKTFYAKFKNN